MKSKPVILAFSTLVAVIVILFLLFDPFTVKYTIGSLEKTGFASYRHIPVKLPEGKDGPEIGFEVPDRKQIRILISNLPGIPGTGKKLEQFIDMIRNNGFVVKQGNEQDFISGYKYNKQYNIPSFVTSDSVIHQIMKISDYLLRYLELFHLVVRNFLCKPLLNPQTGFTDL